MPGSKGVEADLGASWIHGPSNANPIKKLATLEGVKLFATNFDDMQVAESNGALLKTSQIDSGWTAYNTLLKAAKKGLTTDKSLQQAILSSSATANATLLRPIVQFNIATDVEFDYGPLDQMSAKFYDNEEEYVADTDDTLIVEGYDRLVNRVAALPRALDVRLNHVVTHVVNQPTNTSCRVLVITKSQGSLCAQYVVSSLPLGVLKKKSVVFSPVLTAAKQGAISRVGLNVVNKVVVAFNRTFWPDKLFFGMLPSNDTTGQKNRGLLTFFLNGKKAGGSLNALVGYIVGSAAPASELMSDDAIKSTFLSNLRTILGSSAVDSARVTGFVRTAWGSDVYAGGSYSFFASGQLTTDFKTLATEEYAGRLRFVGEHTSPAYRGTVHGAYNTGVSVGTALLELVK